LSSTGPLKTPTSSAATSPPPPAIPKPTTPAPSSSQPDPAPSFPSHDAPKLDIRAILDELEAEEENDRKKTEEQDRAEQAKLIKEEETKEKGKEGEKSEKVQEKAKADIAFGGFSAGFLSKSKQKRPSNSLVSPTPSANKASTSPTPAHPSSPPRPPVVSELQGSPLKSSLSRSTSRASSPAPGSKKQVAFDLPVPNDQVPTREGTPKKQPIILGMGPASDVPGSSESSPAPLPPKKEEFVRPIKDLVVEKPLKKPTPPGPPGGGSEKPKKVSRFRKMKEDMVEKEEEEPKGKGKEKEIISPPVIQSTATTSPATPQDSNIPAPVHTISLSSKPSPSSSTSQPRNPDGTVSYADIAFESDEEDPHLSPDENEDEDDEDWYPSEDEEFDEEDFDVDAALHQREVALEYHRQRLGLAAGRGTGPLGGYHNGEESPFADVVAQQGVSLHFSRSRRNLALTNILDLSSWSRLMRQSTHSRLTSLTPLLSVNRLDSELRTNTSNQHLSLFLPFSLPTLRSPNLILCSVLRQRPRNHQTLLKISKRRRKKG
jgi:hypothetical protein